LPDRSDRFSRGNNPLSLIQNGPTYSFFFFTAAISASILKRIFLKIKAETKKNGFLEMGVF
jgi:hypothetical protein